MRLLPESVHKSDWFSFQLASVLRLALGRMFEIARAYLTEYRKAKSADALYTDLLRLPRADLAGRRLGRDQLAQYIKERFY